MYTIQLNLKKKTFILPTFFLLIITLGMAVVMSDFWKLYTF